MADLERSPLTVFLRPSVFLGLATVAIHLVANGGYGFFRDELYFIVCGQRLAWGYVDQPPLIPLIASITRTLLGDSLFALRVAPTLALAATVALSAEFARVLGGDRFAQTLAGLCVFGASAFLVGGTLLTTDMLQPLTWLGCSWCIVRLAQTGNEKWWLAFGAIVGASLLSKYLIAFYVVGLATGVIATPLRSSLRRPWLWAGVLLALVMILPNLLWQYHHGWPFIELSSVDTREKNVVLSPLAFLAEQAVLLGPVAVPVWIAGLWALGVKPKLAAYRAFAIAWVTLLALLILLHGKAYYAAPIYPVLFAGGAVSLELRLRSVAARWAYAVLLSCVSLMLAPFAIPILPVRTYISYAKLLGNSPSSGAAERHTMGPLPQHFADMFGWPEMAAKVAAVYNRLPPEDRARAVFFGRNYGEAAAIDVFGQHLGLPPAVSGHNNYFLWGPQGHDGSVVILLGGDPAELRKAYQDVTVAGYVDNPFAMPYETNLPIHVLRGLKTSFDWSRLKHFD